MATWFDDNAPQRPRQTGLNQPVYSTGTPAAPPQPGPTTAAPTPPQPTDSATFLGQPGIANGGGWGGGWDQSWSAGLPHALQSAIANGLTGQAAIDWIAKQYPDLAMQAKQIQYYPDKGQYGLPGGMYVAPNAQKGGQLDLIQRSGTEGGGAGGMPPNLPTSGFGAAPPTYTSNPNAPTFTPTALPTGLQTPYTLPTEADVEASPGYATRLAAGVQAQQRGAAAQGSVLSGGSVKALERYAQTYGSNEYANLAGQTQSARAQNYGEYQGAAGLNNQTFQNRTSTYLNDNQRTLTDYLTNVTARRNAENDYWGRLNDLNQTGAGSANGSYRP